MGASVFVFLTSFCINFFLSPYLVETFGEETFGFFNLGNQFVTYAGIITCALNSMAGRFITIAINQNQDTLSKKYFSSVLICNIAISVILFIPAVFMVSFLQRIINITPGIIPDVKLLWALLFASFFLTLIFNIYSVATFVTNKIHLNSIVSIVQNVLRVVVIVALFACLNPSIYFMGIATLICTLFVIFANIRLTRRLLPDMRVDRKLFDIGCVKSLLSSGVWNSITQLAGVLNNGLDLLISNLFISSAAMGIMSISKMIPTYIGQMISLFVGAFVPQLTINYAKQQRKELLDNIEFCNKFMTLVLSIPIAVLVVYGKAFFTLWMPSTDATTLQMISVVTLSVYFIYGPVSVLNDVITITNKHKMIAITYLIAGVLNILLVYILLNTIKPTFVMLLGLDSDVVKMMIIAGVSSLIGVIRNAIFTPLFGAHCLNEKWYRFYPVLIKGILCVALAIVCAIPISIIIPATSWITFIISFIFSASVAIVLCLFIMFNKADRHHLIELIRAKLKKS